MNAPKMTWKNINVKAVSPKNLWIKLTNVAGTFKASEKLVLERIDIGTRLKAPSQSM